MQLGQFRDKMSRLANGPAKNVWRQKAMAVLKQKKMYEAQRDSLAQQNFNMEQAALTTDNLRNTMATVDAMRVANKEMKREYGKVKIDKIDKIYDEMEDLLEQAQEVQELMGRSYNLPDEIDEDELDAELDALQDPDLDVEAFEPGVSAGSSTVPSYLQDSEPPEFIDEPVESESAQAATS